MTIIDKTVAGANTNSYIDPEDVADYFELIDPIKYNNWIAGDLDTARITLLEPFCIAATKLINDQYNFTQLGIRRVEDDQSLPLPRTKFPLDGFDEKLLRQTSLRRLGISDFAQYNTQNYTVDPALVWLLSVNNQTRTVIYFEEDEHPTPIVEAACEIAYRIWKLYSSNIENDTENSVFTNSGTDITSIKVDVISLNFTDKLNNPDYSKGPIPPEAWIKLNKYGKMKVNISTPGYSGGFGIA